MEKKDYLLGFDHVNLVWFSGYYKNEHETAIAIDKDGWLHTGDIGYIDDDGDVFLVDRIKELIKYKGFQVYPTQRRFSVTFFYVTFHM